MNATERSSKAAWWVVLALSAGGAFALLHAENATSEDAPAAKPESSAHADAKAEPAADHEAQKALEKAVADKVAALEKSREKGCLVDPLAIEDLRKRREELDARTKALASREAELKAKESALEEELKRLEVVKASIGAEQIQADARMEEKIAKLVDTIENMSPKKGAEFLSTVDDKLAVVAMTRVSTAKLSKIMNNLSPERAARLSEMMTGYLSVKPKAALPLQAQAPNSQKGGGDGSLKSQPDARNPSSER